jgi:hypothetical protein
MPGAAATGGRLYDRQLLRRRRHEPSRQMERCVRRRCVRLVHDQRPTLVGTDPQLLLQRHLAEERHVELVRQQLTAALAEDREALSASASSAADRRPSRANAAEQNDEW